MLFDPGLGIVLRGDRRNEEGPVRRLQEEKFAGELRHDSTHRRILWGSSGTQGVDEPVFRAVHFLPNPSGTVVQPDIVMASLAPRSFRNLDGRAGRSEEHTSELQSRGHLVCRLLLEKKKK